MAHQRRSPENFLKRLASDRDFDDGCFVLHDKDHLAHVLLRSSRRSSAVLAALHRPTRPASWVSPQYNLFLDPPILLGGVPKNVAVYYAFKMGTTDYTFVRFDNTWPWSWLRRSRRRRTRNETDEHVGCDYRDRTGAEVYVPWQDVCSFLAGVW